VRWIVDDVTKFLERELRRERQYDLLILDPPSYGRGAKGEVFKIENDLPPLLALLGKLMSPQPLGVLAVLPHAGTHAHLAPSHAASSNSAATAARWSTARCSFAVRQNVLPVPSGSFAWWLA
jgi:23S rRNA (cytosine1962-C5)-methyltransferase